MLEEITKRLNALLTADRAEALIRAALIIVVGLFIARWVSRGIGRLVRRGDAQRAVLVQRLTSWALFLVAFAWALQELGFQLGVVLGAAGVATVAIGFASQTSLSNLISGFFLFGERPFKLGDVIEVENVTGEVLAIDLISTKLRTVTNEYVRIPNEVMLKTKVVNYTRFPIRRLDLPIPVAYGDDLDSVKRLLRELADECAHCLAEPEPLFVVTSFGGSSLTLQFSVWCPTQSFLLAKSSLSEGIRREFDKQGLRHPYEHQVVHSSKDKAPEARPSER